MYFMFANFGTPPSVVENFSAREKALAYVMAKKVIKARQPKEH